MADELVRDLVALGRAVDVRPSDDLTAGVMRRLAAEPERDGWWTRQRRIAALVVTAILLALLAAPPVRAAVADWFGFGGVRVERGSEGTDPAPPPPGVTGDLPVSVGFAVHVPTALGEPAGVEVSDDRRIVSMSWDTEDGVVRLDQFDGRLDYTMAKAAPDVTFVTVGGGDGIWFDDAHEVWLLADDGSTATHAPRLAGHTLIWQDAGTTLRLEGDLSLDRAIEIAESAEPVG
ncbi:hypothetical protein [Nocardioides sp. SR21]|uniref:hypothetical protein n=1 Tax=Nocardioides sp. SR21 TaxID=2919501 RepID=UPI001FAA3845|nr:hypothetical protein [Nocardioides sp. SR21]